ncbi:hypothetical protein V8G54_013590 [Vigna mungo]|uniref:Remorin n=1 Tax=Vigna mungo TaxID=3915 RepID=A0AAQ3S521_VIGMU
MTEQQPQTAESETAAPAAPSQPPAEPEPVPEAPKDVAVEKSVIPVPSSDDKPDESKALVLVEKTQEVAEEKPSEGSVNRDAVLARVATEKRLSLIKAWEESEKSKAENNKKASVEADLKKKEVRIDFIANSNKFYVFEQLEKKKAEYAEKIKNKIAEIHKEAEEKRAVIEAKKGEDLLKAEETAAKYRATGTAPKKLLGCF